MIEFWSKKPLFYDGTLDIYEAKEPIKPYDILFPGFVASMANTSSEYGSSIADSNESFNLFLFTFYLGILIKE